MASPIMDVPMVAVQPTPQRSKKDFLVTRLITIAHKDFLKFKTAWDKLAQTRDRFCASFNDVNKMWKTVRREQDKEELEAGQKLVDYIGPADSLSDLERFIKESAEFMDYLYRQSQDESIEHRRKRNAAYMVQYRAEGYGGKKPKLQLIEQMEEEVKEEAEGVPAASSGASGSGGYTDLAGIDLD